MGGNTGIRKEVTNRFSEEVKKLLGIESESKLIIACKFCKGWAGRRASFLLEQILLYPCACDWNLFRFKLSNQHYYIRKKSVRRKEMKGKVAFISIILILALGIISVIFIPRVSSSSVELSDLSHSQRFLSKNESKVSQDLLDLYDSHVTEEGIEKMIASSNKTGIDIEQVPLTNIIDGMVVIDAVASGNGAVASEKAKALLADLEKLGLKNGSIYGRIVSGRFPINNINRLEDLESLNFVRPALAMTNAGSVTSQGDQSMRSDIARSVFSVDGSGVTVGALSDTFDNYLGTPLTTADDDVASGDLPKWDRMMILDDTAWPGIDEGRAILQIIHDVAPGANLAFHTAFNGEADFANGIKELAEVGCDVIVDDVIYFAEPMFQDGIIAQAVDEVKNMGVSYFSSVGNQARNAYESPFNNSGIPGFIPGSVFHDFDPGPGVDVFQSFTLAGNGALTIIVFQWSEPFYSVSGPPGSASDMDIFLTLNTPLGRYLIALSTVFNIGHDPVEVIGLINNESTITVDVSLELFEGPPPEFMKYIVLVRGAYPDSINEFKTYSGSTWGHSNAAGAEAVGAAYYADTPAFGQDSPLIEFFSSAGPTLIIFNIDGTRKSEYEIRNKPEIVAPDGGNTTFFYPGSDYEGDGFPNFRGTSASAPHAAGVAALLLEANGTLTPHYVSIVLEDTALDMDDPHTPGFFDTGFDSGTGFGLIQADLALAALAAPRRVKKTAANGLFDLLSTGDKKTDKGIEKAIKHIDKSLEDDLWEDDSHLTKKGKKVFDEEKKAVKDLEKIVKDQGPIAANAQAAIDLLVGADAALAQNAIDEAIAAGGEAKEIAKAEEEMDKAQKELDKGDFDKAIERYKKAWEHAQKALKKI